MSDQTNRLWAIKHQIMDLAEEAQKIMKDMDVSACDMPSAAPGVKCEVSLSGKKPDKELAFKQKWNANGAASGVFNAGLDVSVIIKA